MMYIDVAFTLFSSVILIKIGLLTFLIIASPQKLVLTPGATIRGRTVFESGSINVDHLHVVLKLDTLIRPLKHCATYMYIQTLRTIMLITMIHMIFSTVRRRLTIPNISASDGIEQLYTNSYSLSTCAGQWGGESSMEVATGSFS